ncbi:MAG: hypothetical protein FJZ01_03270 [Candidatus Sericytochromatia bacterium]|nr:hypothetical protein [Candidatus Tanganyikabacteria bacterium]
MAAVSVMSGCPTPTPTTPVDTSGDSGPAATGTPTPRPTVTARPAGTGTPTPEAVLTPRTTFTSAPQATLAPSGFFAEATPTPPPKTPPPFENIGIELFQGATSSSPFANNAFRIRNDDSSADTPDLPTRRTYTAFQMKGFKTEREGFLPGKYATDSVKVVWTISAAKVEHTNVALNTLPTLKVFFREGGVATDTVRNASTVSVETATVSSGVLLTLTATVSISTDSTAVGTPATDSAAILASNEGKAEFVVETLDRRRNRPVRLVP